MQISELSKRAGVPVATVKYYLREGLLEPGEVVNARRSEYNDGHLTRLRMIRGLVHVLGASIAQVAEVLAIIDAPDESPLEAMGKATSALPAIGELSGEADAVAPERALQLLDSLGYRYESSSTAVRQLDTALDLADSAGITIDGKQILAYGEAARQIARADFARIPWDDPASATSFAVLGTVLYEPVLLALRRLAHHEQALELKLEQ